VVTVQSTGSPVDPDGYELARLEGSEWVPLGHHLAPNDSVTMPGSIGPRIFLGLIGVAATCRVEGQNPRDLTVKPDAITRVSFTVLCARLGAARITATFDGFNETPFGFATSVGGTARGVLRADQPVLATNLFPGPSRILLTYQEGFCELAGSASQEVQVTSDDTLALNFHLHCPVQPDTTDTFLIERIERVGGGLITDRYELLTERGSRSRTLTPPGVVDHGPSWSPDGTRIAFSSDRGGTDGLYVMRSDGTRVVRLGDAAPWCICSLPLAWSPDGRMIAVTGPDDGNIRFIQADGSGERSIPLGWNTSSFSWAPDGSRFVTDHDGDIVIVDVETGAVQSITDDGGGEQHRDLRPAWSPRGDHIVWLSDLGIVPSGGCFGGCFSLSWRLWISDGEGRSPRATSVATYDVTWSPRGSLLALIGGGGVYDATTGTVNPVISPSNPQHGITIGHGSWAPDERHVIYWSWSDNPATPPGSIELVTDRLVEGGERRIIGVRPWVAPDEIRMSWRPTPP
jgi:Tol biopolymer transport system component